MHIVYRFDTGGLENGVVNLINRLPEKDYRHTIVGLKGYNEGFCQRIKTDNVIFCDLHKKDGNDVGMFFRLKKLIRQYRPDIFHTRNTATIETQLVGWWCKIAYRIHGEHGWDMNDMHGSNKKYQILRRVMRRFIHQYVALSKETVNYLKDCIKVPQQRIRHICNGVDTDRFHPGEVTSDKSPAGFLQADSLVFGTVGRLAEVKNQQFLIEGFIQLVEQHQAQANRLRLIIVGDGAFRQNLQERVKQADLQQQVWFVGDSSEVADLMHHMDVFILPSLAEGISNTILEASASGLPVIATRVGGNPELIPTELADTHLIEVNKIEALVNAMAQYIDRPEKLAEDSQIVREHCVNNFSIDTMVEKYNALYQRN